MRRNNVGSTLIEILAVLVPTTLMAASALGFFSGQSRTYLKQDLSVAMEENARAAMGILSDALRNAGCAAPTSNLSAWVSWVSGFTNQPVAIISGGWYGDGISVVHCTPQPVATVYAFAAQGATSISVSSDFASIPVADLFNDSDKSLIRIGETQHAVVTSVSGGTVYIDTDPTATGSQGLLRAFLPGTPITRVDVTTFEVVEDPSTELPMLQIDQHRGTQKRTAEGISDLRITTVVPGETYTVTLTAQSELPDPETGVRLTRLLQSDIQVRN